MHIFFEKRFFIYTFINTTINTTRILILTTFFLNYCVLKHSPFLPKCLSAYIQRYKFNSRSSLAVCTI